MDQVSNISPSWSTDLILYADDVLLSKSIDDQTDITCLHSDINLLALRIQETGLHQNTTKTKLSWKCSPSKLHLFIKSNFSYLFSKSISLATLASSDLSRSEQIDSIFTKPKKHVGLLHKHFDNAGQPALNQLYRSMVLPVLDYSLLQYSGPITPATFQQTQVCPKVCCQTSLWSIACQSQTASATTKVSIRCRCQKLPLLQNYSWAVCHSSLIFPLSPESPFEAQPSFALIVTKN